jgi:glycerol-3-phosphate dehydrogenase
MTRDLTALQNQTFDLLVIGGGIYGTCLAHDASQRGLSVALIEQGEYGNGASANSLRIIHGGLRYLADGDIRWARRMAKERDTWLRIAPDLIHPLRCVVPTYKMPAFPPRPFMRLALIANNLINIGYNIPASHTMPLRDTKTILPPLPNINGGASWHDAQISDPNQLLTTMLHHATTNGAIAHNHLFADHFLQKNGQISGVMATDGDTGDTFPIHAKITVNCAGEGNRLLWQNLLPTHPTPWQPSIAFNFLTRKIFTDTAIGLPDHSGQTLFFAPHEDGTLIGTAHFSATQLTNSHITDFLQKINSAYPPANLTRDDICHIYAGILPAHPHTQNKVKLIRHTQIIDHQKQHNLSGILTILATKYTTARYTAEKTTDLVLHKLGMPFIPCKTANTALTNVVRSA